MMESAKCTIKEAMQTIQELDFAENTCSISRYIKKRIQNNVISKIMRLKRSDISPNIYSCFNVVSPQALLWKEAFNRNQTA